MSDPTRRKVLQLLRAGVPDADIARRLGVGRWLPRMLRGYLNMPPNNPRNRPWTEADFALLREHYAKPRRERPRLAQLAQRLRRTISAVKMTAAKLRAAGTLVEGQ